MLSEHQKETAFLRRCISYEDSNEGRQLDKRIVQIQREERSLRRVTWIIALLTALVGLGFCYVVFLIEDFPNHVSQFTAQFISNTICALGIGSLVSLLAFGLLGLRNRRELNLRREECRQLVTALFERHLGRHPARPQDDKAKEPAINPAPERIGEAPREERTPVARATAAIDSPDC